MQIQAAVEIWVLLSLPEVLPPYLSWSSCYVFFFLFFFLLKVGLWLDLLPTPPQPHYWDMEAPQKCRGPVFVRTEAFCPFGLSDLNTVGWADKGVSFSAIILEKRVKLPRRIWDSGGGGGKKATHPERKVFQGYHCLSWCLKSTLSLRFGASSFPRGRDFLNEIPIWFPIACQSRHSFWLSKKNIDLTSNFLGIKRKSLLKYLFWVKVIDLGKISVLNGQRKGFSSRWYLN